VSSAHSYGKGGIFVIGLMMVSGSIEGDESLCRQCRWWQISNERHRRDLNMRYFVQSLFELIVSSSEDARDGSLARSMEASLERNVEYRGSD
jgi:hypothetical protein